MQILAMDATRGQTVHLIGENRTPSNAHLSLSRFSCFVHVTCC